MVTHGLGGQIGISVHDRRDNGGMLALRASSWCTSRLTVYGSDVIQVTIPCLR